MFAKKLSCIVLVALALGSSCKKSPLVAVQDDNGCISRIKRDYSDPNKTELAAALKLLQDNHIATANQVVGGATLNDTITTNGPVHVMQHVFNQLYANNQPILFAQVIYHFNNGIYQSTSGYLYNSVTLDTVPHTRLSQLRYVFMQEAKNDGYAVTNKITSSCLVAEFGYLDISPDSHGQLVKAWRVTPPNQSYPLAMIRDDNGHLIYYTNGIMTLNKASH
ncbi:hypothetical protein [Mucilaginibacter sp. OK283]|jgi:hypothetical protein|uniref:hypothetical protein n=1 Tax=Mucilaginibacter sp. OK283 TaxID=1881049 RepID=UPI0008ABF0BB|nr:hypothetical protein [Mucilaginibacter sp. OK283]SEP35765.1 hypothetical protein SAMN05428947_11269 [Mucilaginibacter sp. OK283]